MAISPYIIFASQQELGINYTVFDSIIELSRCPKITAPSCLPCCRSPAWVTTEERGNQ